MAAHADQIGDFKIWRSISNITGSGAYTAQAVAENRLAILRIEKHLGMPLSFDAGKTEYSLKSNHEMGLSAEEKEKKYQEATDAATKPSVN